MVANHEPTLGVHLLETITKGMYSEPLHCMREYIQNAYDSIRAARRNNLLSHDDGEVRIVLDPETRTVRIRDNGTGLGPEEAAVYLLDLGNSDKAKSDIDSMRNAGFRGIGRMAGITYCEKLRFETSNGDGRKCTVTFDAAGINQLTRAGQKATTIVNAIRKNSNINEEVEDQGKHYLEVILEGISKAGESFLNEKRLEDYLKQVAPVTYNLEWLFSGKIQSFAEIANSASSLDHVKVTIRDTTGHRRVDIRRPFQNTFEVVNKQGAKRIVKVTDVIALPQDEDPVHGWWGWLAVHERQGALADVSFEGLRIRMHNIAIGDATIIRKLFTSAYLANWCFGEIHITDHQLTPNAQRDNFEDSSTWDRIKQHLHGEVVQIERNIRKESRLNNESVKKHIRRAEVYQRDVHKRIEHGFVSPDDQKATIQKLDANIESLEQQAGRRKHTEKEELTEAIRQLRKTKERASAVKITGADKAQAHLSRQARGVLRTVREILQSELDEETFRTIIDKINAALQPGQRT